jgi:2-dehydro-3-deoxyphosphogluconate aldolase / (4S)-4-hydroxy-2-oxoglutarate aldolase
MNKNENIIRAIEQSGFIPVFNDIDLQVVINIVDAAYAGGVRVFEFTNRSTNAFQIFEGLKLQIKRYTDIFLGVGTVLDISTTEKFIDAGADFIVSPIVKPAMGSVCLQRNIPWIPGCATLTEIVTAKEAGAEVIKIFPGSVLGPAFVSSVLPVVPGLKLMPTGGVEPTKENLSAWFNAGVVCVGMGSQLLKKDIIAKGNWSQLTNDIKKTLELISEIKKSIITKP